MATGTSQRGRGRIPTPVANGGDDPARIVADIRSGVPFFLTRSQLAAAGRRLASIAALVCIDLAGLVIGVYAALVARDLYYGRTPILWGVLWRVETDWLPFLTLITVLVFSQAGLYEERGRRAGLRPDPLVASARCADHARLRDRNRAQLLDVRACADGGAPVRDRDRRPARELRLRQRRGARAARRSPPRAARRLGREPGPPARRARLCTERDRLRVRRRGRPFVRRDRPAGARRRRRPAARSSRPRAWTS